MVIKILDEIVSIANADYKSIDETIAVQGEIVKLKDALKKAELLLEKVDEPDSLILVSIEELKQRSVPSLLNLIRTREAIFNADYENL